MAVYRLQHQHGLYKVGVASCNSLPFSRFCSLPVNGYASDTPGFMYLQDLIGFLVE